MAVKERKKKKKSFSASFPTTLALTLVTCRVQFGPLWSLRLTSYNPMDLDLDFMTPRKLSFGMDFGKENKLRKRLLLTSSNQQQL